MPVVFLSGHGDIPTSVRAMRQGAEDFLTKRAPKAELVAAIERALARDTLLRSQRARLRELRAPLICSRRENARSLPTFWRAG
jgi:FixJ family two-component response regulator